MLPLTIFVAGAVPAGTMADVPNVNVRPLTVSVYDWMNTLSSGVGPVIVGFLRLLRRVTQAVVVVV